jgi:hypothetical protein
MASGISSFEQTSTGFNLITSNGQTFSFTVPNGHTHSNLNTILEKFTLSTDNQLLFNGQPIEGGTVDLSNYYNKTEIDDKLNSLSQIDDNNASASSTYSSMKIVDLFDELTNGNIQIEPVESIATTNGQANFVVAEHEVGSKFLLVYVDGVKISHSDYTDVDSTHITLNTDIASTVTSGIVVTSLVYATTNININGDLTINDIVDNSTIQVVGNKLVAKTLDGLLVNITELNTLSGMTENIKGKLDALANAGMIFKGTTPTKATLLALTGMVSGNVKIVLSDESNSN